MEIFLFSPVTYMVGPLFRSLKEAFIYISNGEMFIVFSFLSFFFFFRVAG